MAHIVCLPCLISLHFLVFGHNRWVQEVDWEMTEPTIIDHVKFLGVVGPDGMSLAKVTPRKK